MNLMFMAHKGFQIVLVENSSSCFFRIFCIITLKKGVFYLKNYSFPTKFLMYVIFF